MQSAIRLIAVLAVLGVVALLSAGPTQAAPPPLIEPMIWQLNRDYPEGTPADASLAIDTVYIKTHDGSDWMSTYDEHPLAVSGPGSIQNLISIYGAQGIGVAAWFVPKGNDYDAQVALALQVIDSGVTALYADLEPFAGFCYLNCADLATNFWSRVRAERPNARLGVIYDPRPWWWNQSATSLWFQNADVAMPMCYWETYSGQGVFGDPAGCVTQAKADLATLSPGRSLEYLPILQGDTSPDRVQLAIDAAIRSSASRVSLWRRGVVSGEVWNMIANYQAPSGPHCAEQLVDGCLIRKGTDSAVYMVQGGARFAFPNIESFNAMGLQSRDVQVMPDGVIDNLTHIPADGTLLKEFGTDTVYVIIAGTKFPLPGGEAPAAGVEDARIVPPNSTASIPTVPANYTRMRAEGTAEAFVILNGARIQLDELGEKALTDIGANGAVYDVPQGILDQVPVMSLKRGDVDCSGELGIPDVLSVLRQTIGLANPSVCIGVTGDVTCDGLAMANDALLVLLHFAEAPATTVAGGCPAIGEPLPALLPPPA